VPQKRLHASNEKFKQQGNQAKFLKRKHTKCFATTKHFQLTKMLAIFKIPKIRLKMLEMCKIQKKHQQKSNNQNLFTNLFD
jgi:hypothetical protein